MTEKMRSGYAILAATFWQIVTRIMECEEGIYLLIFLPVTLGQKAKLHPFLLDCIHMHRSWKEPKQKHEPYTYDMFEALTLLLVKQNKSDVTVFLSHEYVVFDWQWLGLHTGLHLGEYGQSKIKKGELFARVPKTPLTGEWAGQPIAFLQVDFTYYDKQMVCHPYTACLRKWHLAEFIFVQFRFDKSGNNFTIWKFCRVPGSILCPVKASLSILK